MRGWGHPLSNPGAEGWQSVNTAAVSAPADHVKGNYRNMHVSLNRK